MAELVYAYHPMPAKTLDQIAESGGWSWTELFRFLTTLPAYVVTGSLPISKFVGTGGKVR